MTDLANNSTYRESGYSNIAQLFKIMSLRHPLKYAVKRANTERLKHSSVPYMQKILNIDDRKRKLELDDLHKQLNQTKKRRFSLSNFLYMQVNYVI